MSTVTGRIQALGVRPWHQSPAAPGGVLPLVWVQGCVSLVLRQDPCSLGAHGSAQPEHPGLPWTPVPQTWHLG